MKINISIPKSYNELSENQLKQLASLFYSKKQGADFDSQCFKILSNIRWYQVGKKIKQLYLFSQIPLKQLRDHYNFIYTENNRTIFPTKTNGYFPPLDKIANLTVEEFSVADDLHIRFRETQDIQCLIYLAATLYSKTKKPRQPFDKLDLPQKAKKFESLGLPVLLAIELAYSGSKNNIVKRFPQAFPNADTKQKSKKYGFSKVILQMAGGKFGNHEQTKSTNIYTFLEEFNQNLKDAKKIT